MVEHVLALVVLDAAEEAAARHIFAGLLLERCRSTDIDRLLGAWTSRRSMSVERQPAKSAFEDTHTQARVFVKKPAANKRANKPHRPPGVGCQTSEEDVVP